MSKHIEEEEGGLPGQDSFLDVVANIVGILIILVTVVGSRAAIAPKNVDPTAQTQSTSTQNDALIAQENVEVEKLREQVEAETTKRELLKKEIQSLYRETEEAAKQIALEESEVATQDNERVQLIASIALEKEELDQKRQALTLKKQEELKLSDELRKSEAKVLDLRKEMFSIDAAPRQVETIESLPTPLARTVTGDEIHLQLKRGLVAVVPVKQLTEQLKSSAEGNISKLSDRNSVTDTIGPIDGFRLRYKMGKHPVMMNGAAGSQRVGEMVQLEYWEMVPNATDLGVTVEQALLPNADLQRALQGKSPDFTTVTIWTYPDSFEDFRALKKKLFEMGYSAAARPLPEGIRIGGSPNGTKSSVQ